MSRQTITTGERETRQLARQFAAELEFPCVILLEGDLGAGKTTFVKGLVAGLGGDPEAVHSPTFSLVNHYQTGDFQTIHIDLYRLDESGDQYSIGLDEILATEDLVVIEWADKLRLEVDTGLRIRIERLSDETRRITREPF